MFHELQAPLQSLKGRFFIFAFILVGGVAHAGGLSMTAALQALSPSTGTTSLSSSVTALALSPSAALLSPTAAPMDLSPKAAPKSSSSTSSKVWDENAEVRIRGQRLEYFEGGEALRAEGGVDLQSGDIHVHADKILLDMKSNSLAAQGNVVWCQEGNTVYANALELNLKTQLGSAKQLIFRQGSWAAWGESAEKTSDTDISLDLAEATSCLRERPHYRLVASEIRMKLGDRIWLENVIVYIGLVPLFYLPSYSQSLRDPRPPFEIRPGYSAVTGAFVRAAYNFYLNDSDYGSVRVDWMDLLGTGYGLSDHYKLFGGEGNVAGYMTLDPNSPGDPSWSGTFSHHQEFGKGLRLLINVDSISQYTVNQTYDLNQVDTFQGNSYFSLQSSQKTYSWNIGAGQTQVLQPTFGADPNSASKNYVVTTQTLPSMTYTRNTLPLIKNSAFYWGFSAQAIRTLVVPQTISVYTPLTVSAQPTPTSIGAPVSFTTSLYDLGHSYYNDVVGFTPTLSHSLRLIRGSALSTNLSFNESYLKNEGSAGDTGPGLAVSTANLIETVHMPLRPSLAVDLGWHYNRQLSQPETLRFSGLLLEQATLNATWAPNEATNIIASTDYDFLPYQVDTDLKRLDLIHFQGSYTPNLRHSFTLVSAYQAQTGQIKTVDTDVTYNGPRKAWEFAAGTTWVNNEILLVPSTIDVNAPNYYSYESPRQTPDQFLINWRTNFAVTDKWGLSIYQRFNVATPDIEEQDYGINRDLHCWNIGLFCRDQVSTGLTFGFTLTLKAAPQQVNVSSNQLANDLFNDVSFGY
jgi:hypothetical protein